MKKNQIVFNSERLIYRQLTEVDVTDSYVGWLNDPIVNRYLEVRHELHTLEGCRDFVMRMNLSPSEYLHGIFRKSDGLHIGNAKIGLINRHHKNAQVSLLIGDKNSWGQGFAIEAVNAMSEIGFSQLGLQKLEAGCYEENLASLRVFLRCGYSVEGFMRNHVISNGVRKGCFWLGVTADEWRK